MGIPRGDALESAEQSRARSSAMGRGLGRTRQTPSRVRELRVSKGLTQIALAAAVGTTVDTVRKAERGFLTQFRVTTILRIANALECGAADLFPILGERLDRL